ncbi:hypothetical protein A3C23_04335 [Candidatus Roizmanbacteria bacterium RIFCSPHIGHO2_02_FULL_37_13b]|uniref:Uncharacterized protein n=1 Tax=Candidatus Roizmanbacteria bacterium RIFCSPLOWO2_02_FULL_36_11 TaxID=1802071 RepID=A0A1F7JH50_9BACT|nr:MAG: hypothetical protein A3C23_04335 [Candidatus Roizmanbacteria bacterium RIFCSPHIGHO2_02_FULL_37_13b]OGK54937.1 MAG: hypothetical protein A3H78_00480 [Candidatus Roizmanbacteria bacterium RIFCSPLOWO2_02_FULL_36_11]
MSTSSESGVVLLISEGLLKQHPLDDPREAGLINSISITEIPLEFVMGIKPFGNFEFDALEYLQDRVAPLTEGPQDS